MDLNKFSLKLKTKDGNVELKDHVNSETSLSELRNIVSNTVSIPSSNIKILFGYPRKMLNLTKTESIAQAGIKAGDTLFVEESCDSSTGLSVSSVSFNYAEDTTKSASLDEKQHISENMPREVKGIFLKKEVPSDNSCLFTSMGFVLSGNLLL